VTRENIFRPKYKGQGEIFFGPPIFGEYEIMNLAGEEWILEQGSYVCSDAGIEIGVWRNKALTTFFGGEGWFQTTVKGTGKVVLQAIARINRELGTTAAVITHNAAIAAIADRVLRLADGRIAEVTVNAKRLTPEEIRW
jgi:uncharacterized protein (AIM24 family)